MSRRFKIVNLARIPCYSSHWFWAGSYCVAVASIASNASVCAAGRGPGAVRRCPRWEAASTNRVRAYPAWSPAKRAAGCARSALSKSIFSGTSRLASGPFDRASPARPCSGARDHSYLRGAEVGAQDPAPRTNSVAPEGPPSLTRLRPAACSCSSGQPCRRRPASPRHATESRAPLPQPRPKPRSRSGSADSRAWAKLGLVSAGRRRPAADQRP